MNVSFTSVWSDGTIITTPATYDPATGEVTAKTVDVDPDACLVREYITLQDDEEIDVCMVCHSYVMKTVMEEGVGKSLKEVKICSGLSSCPSGDE
jgi:hypothetical protein